MSGAVIWAGSPRRQGGLCSESPGASRGLLGIPRGTAWWPGLLGGHLGPLVISQMANPDLQTLDGGHVREKNTTGGELGEALCRIRRRCQLSGDQPARSRGQPTCWKAPPWASALPLAQGRMVRPGRPPAGPERPGGPSWWHAPGCPPHAPAGTLRTAPSDAAARPGCSLRWGSGEAGLSARSRALSGSDSRGR